MLSYKNLAPDIPAIIEAYHARCATHPASAAFFRDGVLPIETLVWYFRDYLRGRYDLGPDEVFLVEGDNLIDAIVGDREAQDEILRRVHEDEERLQAYVGCPEFWRLMGHLGLDQSHTDSYPIHPVDDKIKLYRLARVAGIEEFIPPYEILDYVPAAHPMAVVGEVFASAARLLADSNGRAQMNKHFVVKIEGCEGGAGSTHGITLAELGKTFSQARADVMSLAKEAQRDGLALIVQVWWDNCLDVSVNMTGGAIDVEGVQILVDGNHRGNAFMVGGGTVLHLDFMDKLTSFVMEIYRRVAESSVGPIKGPFSVDVIYDPVKKRFGLVEFNTRNTATRAALGEARTLLANRGGDSYCGMVIFLDDVKERDPRKVVEAMDEAGLSLNTSTWTGMKLTAPHTVPFGKVTVTISAEDLTQARSMVNRLCDTLGVDQIFTESVTTSLSQIAPISVAA